MRDTVADSIVDDTFSEMVQCYYDCLKIRKTDPEIAKHGVKAFRDFCRSRLKQLQKYIQLNRIMPPSLQMQKESVDIIQTEIDSLRRALNTTRLV